MHNILAITDRAVVAYLIGQSVGDSSSVYPMKRADPKTLPCVIVHSKTAAPLTPWDATYHVDVSVLVRGNATVDVGEDSETPVVSSDAFLENVMLALHRFGDGAQSGAGLADAITQAAGGQFTCQDAEITSIECMVDYPHEMDAWTDVINLRLVCCPADVT